MDIVVFFLLNTLYLDTNFYPGIRRTGIELEGNPLFYNSLLL